MASDVIDTVVRPGKGDLADMVEAAGLAGFGLHFRVHIELVVVQPIGICPATEGADPARCVPR